MRFSFFTIRRGFTLVEVVISLGIFLLFAVGIYSGIQFTFKSVYASRVRILETALLNEQIEIIRNIPYEDVGIVSGSPAGVLDRSVVTTRNSIEFLITRTIRNIDDGFDGTIDGEAPQGKSSVCHGGNTLWVAPPAVPPHVSHGDAEGICSGDGGSAGLDTYAADYKFVDVSVICTRCGQSNPLVMSTLVAPKFLEGDPDNGALKIEVYENSYQTVVPGALVHISSTSTDPTYDFSDTTNNNGELLIVDLPAGQSAYSIVITKDGYTTSRTTSTIPNPLIPSASVVAQSLQTISFEINPVSSIRVSTLTESCVAISGVSVSVTGERLLGTSPDTLETDTTITTNGSGTALLSVLNPDDYNFRASGYDVIGTIPIFPLTVAPGSDYALDLILGPNKSDSLLVHVKDNTSDQPIPNATVTVTRSGQYNETLVTGIGHTRQNDWSGGSGQVNYTDITQFYVDDGNLDEISQPGNITLAQVGLSYTSDGWLESSTFDLGTGVTFQTLDWQPFVQPIETGASSLRFQVASSVSSTPASWEFIGPDGTSGTYYDEFTVDIHNSHTNDRYFRYRAYFSTDDTNYTPILSDFSVGYTTSCTPPGQAYFGDVSNTNYDIEIRAEGYVTVESTVSVEGDTYYVGSMVEN